MQVLQRVITLGGDSIKGQSCPIFFFFPKCSYDQNMYRLEVEPKIIILHLCENQNGISPS